MLLGVEGIGGEISFVEDTGLGTTEVTEGVGATPTGGLEVVDVEELVGPLGAGLEAEEVLSPGGIEASTILLFTSVDVGLIPGKYDKGWISGTPPEYIVV